MKFTLIFFTVLILFVAMAYQITKLIHSKITNGNTNNLSLENDEKFY